MLRFVEQLIKESGNMKKIKDSDWEIISEVFMEYRNGVNWKCSYGSDVTKVLKKYFKETGKLSFDYSKFDPYNYPELYIKFLNDELHEAHEKLFKIGTELYKLYLDT